MKRDQLTNIVIRLFSITCLVFAFLVLHSCNNNLITALTRKIELDDPDPPVPGDKGDISAQTRAVAMTLSWEKAFDEVVDQENLQYKIVYSEDDSIGSVEKAEENGTLGLDWTPDISEGDISNLSILTKYYVNVLVKDVAGNKAEYGSTSAETKTDPDDPVPGGTKNLTFDPINMEDFTISWPKATDEISPQRTLEYVVVYSTDENIGTLADAEDNGTYYESWDVDIDTKTVTGVLDDIQYWVNVIVRDEVGNKAVYNMSDVTTEKHPRIFFTETLSPSDNIVGRSELVDPAVEDLVTLGTTANPFAIAVDPVERKIYWIDSGTDMIQRADFDGGNVENLITTGLNSPYGIAVDFSTPNRYLYWTDSTNNIVYRSPLPPTNTNAATYELLNNANDGVDFPIGIEVDKEADFFFWTEAGTTRRIRRAEAGDPSGTIINLNFLGGTEMPIDVAVDYNNNVVYWTDWALDMVRSNTYTALAFTGSINDLIDLGLDTPCGITIDIGNADIYWIDTVTNAIYKSDVIPASGSDADNYFFLTSLNDPRGIQKY